MNETIFLSDDSHVLTTKNKNMPARTLLEVVKEKLLVLEQRTTASAAQAMASRLAAWRDEVSNLSTAAAAARLFLEFLDGTENAEFTAGMLAERAAAKAAMARRSVPARTVLSTVCDYNLKVVHAAYKLYRDAEKEKARLKPKPKASWKKGTSAFFTNVKAIEAARDDVYKKSYKAGLVVVNTDEHVIIAKRTTLVEERQKPGALRSTRRDDERFYRQVEQPLMRGKGFVVLSTGLRLAAEELHDARSAGLARTRGWQALQHASTGAPVLLLYNTDALEQPPLGVTCMLALFAGLMGASLQQLGIARDPLVLLNPGLVSFADVLQLRDRQRACGGPLGQLRLPRIRGLLHAHDVLQRAHGVFWFGGLVRRGDQLHPHAMGFNAGASLFYLNPWVVVVDPIDRLYPMLFYARMDRMYGVMVPPLLACRMVAVERRARMPLRLPLAVSPPPLATVSAGQGRKRGRSRPHRHRGGRKRPRG